MRTDSESSLTQLLLREQLDMAAGLCSLKESQKQPDRRLGALESRYTSLETTISQLSRSPPQPPASPSQSKTDGRLDTWTRWVSSVTSLARLLMLWGPRILIVWG